MRLRKINAKIETKTQGRKIGIKRARETETERERERVWGGGER